MIAPTDTVVLGPSPEATAQLRSAFGESAQEWRRKADLASSHGEATTYRAIAEIAARVAGGV